MKIRISQVSRIASVTFLGVFMLLFIISCQKDENLLEESSQTSVRSRSTILDKFETTDA